MRGSLLTRPIRGLGLWGGLFFCFRVLVRFFMGFFFFYSFFTNLLRHILTINVHKYITNQHTLSKIQLGMYSSLNFLTLFLSLCASERRRMYRKSGWIFFSFFFQSHVCLERTVWCRQLSLYSPSPIDMIDGLAERFGRACKRSLGSLKIEEKS